MRLLIDTREKLAAMARNAAARHEAEALADYERVLDGARQVQDDLPGMAPSYRAFLRRWGVALLAGVGIWTLIGLMVWLLV